ncbi:MAG: hypothetical protein QOH98_2030, partial [Methylobacteriaceae bacterium]|nr:hypothetical protein [Methylobacteriaceae bacterium]
MHDLSERIATRCSRDWALKQEIEEFLYREADILDERRFKDWLELLAEDITYF